MQTKQKSQSSGNPKEKQKVIEEDKTIKTFTSVTAIQWEGLPNSSRLYSPRFDHAVTRRRNKIYLFGGDTGNVYFKNQFLADLHEYDLECMCVEKLFFFINRNPHFFVFFFS